MGETLLGTAAVQDRALYMEAVFGGAEGMGAPVQHGYDMDDNLKKLTLETTGLGM